MENKDIKALNEEQLEKISGGAVAELPEDERILPFEPGKSSPTPKSAVAARTFSVPEGNKNRHGRRPRKSKSLQRGLFPVYTVFATAFE